MQIQNIGVIILAAGLGTRMKSDKAKVLHEIDHKSMIHYVVETAHHITRDNLVVVVGHQAETVKMKVREKGDARFALQEKQLGTGHAVSCGIGHLQDEVEDVVILCGDTPLLTSATLSGFIENHRQSGRDITILVVEVEDPTGYGRILLDENEAVVGIVEEADASLDQKRIRLINSGIYCVKMEWLQNVLPKLTTANAQGEMYLTDIIGIGHREKIKIGIMRADDADEIMGVNTIAELKRAESVLLYRKSKTS